jgi:hypothetical protein
MYSSVTVLILVLIGQPPLRGKEYGTTAAAMAGAQKQGGMPSADAKPVGENSFAHLDKIPSIGGSSSQTLKTGEWGRWPCVFHAFQILSKNEMLVTYYFDANVRVLKMRGFPTTGLADGDEFTLLSLARVTGTTSYTTRLGAIKTVHEIGPLSDLELTAFAEEEKRVEQALQTAAEFAKIAASRTWNVKGQLLRAKLTGILVDRVELTIGKDKKKSYDLNDLSKSDKAYVKSIQARLDDKPKDDERDARPRIAEVKSAKPEAIQEHREQEGIKKPPEKRAAKADDDNVVYLSDLKESSVDVWVYIPGFGFGKDGSFFIGNGKYAKIVLDGKESPKGIFAHPKANGSSKVRYDVKGQKHQYFRTTVGVADERRHGPYTPLIFEVWGDGKRLWQSKPVKLWGQPQECAVKLPDVSQLELRVECPGDASFAYAVWVEPRLTDE